MRVILLLLASVPQLGYSVQWTNSTSAALQASLTSGSVAPGDTIWLRGGTYIAPATNAYSLNDPMWLATIQGETNNVIVIRSYPGEWAKIDLPWRFGSGGGCVRFRDLEMYDSMKGHHSAIPGYPHGPWTHVDVETAHKNEYVNCYIHDVHGGFLNISMRGCIIIYSGWNNLEHVLYPAYGPFTGNLVGWQSGDTVNLNVAGFIGQSNIMFGVCQTIGGNGGSDFNLNEGPAELSFNYTYNRYTAYAFPGSFSAGVSGAIIRSNVIVGPLPVYMLNTSSVDFRANTVHMNGFENRQVMIKSASVGTWLVDSNHYTAQSPFNVIFAQGNDSLTFAQWQTNGFDTHLSTATNSAFPSDSVHVIPNADEPKRCHIAVYNWTQAANVSVSLSSVLNTGDTYRLYSAQNYGAGAIQTGTYNGTAISVPMTNLTVAPILYGTNDNTYAQAIVTPPVTSPEFGAFVVQGSASSIPNMNVTTLNIGQ